jgi:hypothetical protein
MAAKFCHGSVQSMGCPFPALESLIDKVAIKLFAWSTRASSKTHRPTMRRRDRTYNEAISIDQYQYVRIGILKLLAVGFRPHHHMLHYTLISSFCFTIHSYWVSASSKFFWSSLRALVAACRSSSVSCSFTLSAWFSVSRLSSALIYSSESCCREVSNVGRCILCRTLSIWG